MIDLICELCWFYVGLERQIEGWKGERSHEREREAKRRLVGREQ